ncbi:MAG: cupredoxin domain-containing protein [Anaerolineales bacterium]
MNLRSHLSKLGFFLAVVLVAFSPIPRRQRTPEQHTVEIQASQFAFQPAVVKVKPGDRVTLELTSTDVVHGLYLDGYDLEITADPGQTSSVTFTADRQGSFRFRCSVSCGALHPFMIGKLKVGSNLLLWRGGGLAALTVLGLWWRGKT